MAFDLNTLGDNHDKEADDKIQNALGPLASLLKGFDGQVRLHGLEEMTRRIDEALPILRGQKSSSGDSNQLSEQLAAIDVSDRNLALRLISGDIHADDIQLQFKQLGDQLSSYQNGSQVDGVTPNHALTTATSDSVKLATDADLLSGEIEALEKEIHEQTEKLESSFPSDDDVSWIKLGKKGTIELHKATSEIASKQVELDKKTAELAVISKKLVQSTAAAQTALNDLASSNRNNGSQSNPGSLALGL